MYFFHSIFFVVYEALHSVYIRIRTGTFKNLRLESLPNLLKIAKSHIDEVDLGGDDIYQICSW